MAYRRGGFEQRIVGQPAPFDMRRTSFALLRVLRTKIDEGSSMAVYVNVTRM